MAAPVDPRLVRRSRAVRRHLVLAVLLGLLTSVAVVAQAGLVSAVVTDRFAGRPVTTVAVAVAACLAARALIRWVHTATAARAAARVKAGLRREILDDVLDPRRLGPRPSSAALVTLLGRGLDALDGYVGRFLPQVVLAATVPVVVVVAIGSADLLSAVIIGVTLPMSVVFMVLVGLLTRDRLDRRWQAMERLGRHFGDVLDGLVLLKSFDRRQERGLREVGDRQRRETVRALRIAFLSSLVLELFATLAVALVAVSVGLRVVEGHLGLGTALFVLLLAPEAFLPVRQLGASYHDSTEGVEATQAALAVLDHPRHEGTGPAPDPRLHDLVLDGVVVRHDGRDLPALRLAHHRVRPGEVVAVTGPSGCGKSTLLDVVLGFVRPGTGYALVGDTDLADVDPVAWRRRVAWVPQVPGTVAGTVEDNVRLGDDEPSTDVVRDALDRAGAADLPLGHPVGEAGEGLSAGERRRVAIARALLQVRGGAGLVLLDEPTAGLDDRREAEVLETLRSLGATVLVVAHRPDTIAAADRELRLGDRVEVAA